MTTVPPEPTQTAASTAKAHRSGPWWRFVFIFGSLRLALILLFTVAASIGFATFMESRFDQNVAAYYIYNAVWFKFWLLLLCVNLACAALTRWPWKRKHAGFVITHAGIITLLIGSELGQIFGFEAFVDLDKTKPPVHELITKSDVLIVASSTGYQGETPFNPEFAGISKDSPYKLTVPNEPYQLVLDASSDRLTVEDTVQPSTEPLAPAGIAIRFLNSGMGQDVPTTLMAADGQDQYDFFGMAAVALVDSLPDPAPPARDANTLFHETHVVFSKHPQGPVIDCDADTTTGYHFILLDPTKPGKPFQLEVLLPGQTSNPVATIPLPAKGGEWLTVPGTKPAQKLLFRIAEYWPDFYMNGNRPDTASQKPNNPAALIQVLGPTMDLPPPVPAAPAPVTPNAKAKLALLFALGTEPNTVVYESTRDGQVVSRGLLKQGETMQPGWSKWQVKLEGALPHAAVKRQVREVAADVPSSPMTTLLPGVQAHLVLKATGERISDDVWILAGTSRELFTKNDFVQVGYGQKTIPLDFSITLQDFQVPRDEGTETPSDYISTLQFQEAATGRIVHGVAHMNEPAMFPGEFWRSLLGWNYKFSQANWNPDNLNQTTLQVLYDPGWPFKWVGSIGICLGIATMFYFWPNKNAPKVRIDP